MPKVLFQLSANTFEIKTFATFPFGVFSALFRIQPNYESFFRLGKRRSGVSDVIRNFIIFRSIELILISHPARCPPPPLPPGICPGAA